MKSEQERGIEGLLRLPIGDLVDMYSKMPESTQETRPKWQIEDNVIEEKFLEISKWIDEYLPVVVSGVAVASDTEKTVLEMLSDVKELYNTDSVGMEYHFLLARGKVWTAEGMFWQKRFRVVIEKLEKESDLDIRNEEKIVSLDGQVLETYGNAAYAVVNAVKFYLVAQIMVGSRMKRVEETIVNHLFLGGYEEEALGLLGRGFAD